MKTYNFDRIIDRRQTGAYKTESLKNVFGRDDLLPLWVADMDFETPDFITDALRQRLEHSLYGYTMTPDKLWECTAKWLSTHHGWTVPHDWFTFIPGIVRGIAMAIHAFTSPGDKIIIQPPVYHPFRLVPEKNGREIVCNPLRQLPDGSYEMDFGQLAEVADKHCRMLLLSNPHNPGGVVWDEKTLKRLAEFCHSRNILVISDEIHADMALWTNRHIPFATVSPEAEACSITFGAPSKTFNIAGLVSSYAVVPSPAVRTRFYDWLEANEMNQPTLFSPIATIAAYEHGEEWRQQMLRYIEGNIDFVIDFMAEHLPCIRPLRPQASFLVWLDCRNLRLSHNDLIDLFVNRARLALNDGLMFGREGNGFMRLNVGVSRSVIVQALQQLKEAVHALQSL